MSDSEIIDDTGYISAGAEEEPEKDEVDSDEEIEENEEEEVEPIVEEEEAGPQYEYKFLPKQYDPIDQRTPIEHSKKIKIVAPNLRITSDIMARYELTNAVSIRAQQISNDGQCMNEIGDLSDAISIARDEIKQRRCPLELWRKWLGDKFENGIRVEYWEVWDVNDMGFPIGFAF